MFFESIVREDRSIIDLLNGDYTFVNERLAAHYGIPNVYGSQFRRVKLEGDLDVRRGLAGQGRHRVGDFRVRPDFAGAARQVGDDEYPGHRSARSAAQRSGAEGSCRGKQRSLKPCGSGWKRIAPIRPARAVTR